MHKSVYISLNMQLAWFECLDHHTLDIILSMILYKCFCKVIVIIWSIISFRVWFFDMNGIYFFLCCNFKAISFGFTKFYSCPYVSPYLCQGGKKSYIFLGREILQKGKKNPHNPNGEVYANEEHVDSKFAFWNSQVMVTRDRYNA